MYEGLVHGECGGWGWSGGWSLLIQKGHGWGIVNPSIINHRKNLWWLELELEVGQKLELEMEVDEDVDEVEVEQQLEVLHSVFCKQIWHGQRAYHSSDGWIELVQIYSHHSRIGMWENK